MQERTTGRHRTGSQPSVLLLAVRRAWTPDGSSGMPLEGTFYTVEEAAELLGIAPVTLYNAIRQGRVNVVRVGGRVFLTPIGLEEYRTTILGRRGWAERKNPAHEPDRRAAERQRAYRERHKRGEHQRTHHNEEE